MSNNLPPHIQRMIQERQAQQQPQQHMQQTNMHQMDQGFQQPMMQAPRRNNFIQTCKNFVLACVLVPFGVIGLYCLALIIFIILEQIGWK